MVDFDYLDKLSDKEKEFLNKFVSENYITDFRHEKPLIKSKKKRKVLYRENNSRNQDITSYLGNYKKLESYNDLTDDDLKARSPEDALITMIDAKKKS